MSSRIGPDELDGFRNTWDGERILDLLQKHGGRILVTWQIGVGKSHNLDNIIETAIRLGAYDLVVAFLPTRKVLDERRWILNPPSDVRVTNLRPRPRQSCGNLDEQWSILESQGMGLLGRRMLCVDCSKLYSCFWLNQYGRNLEGAQVIFATQTHLERDPLFVSRLRTWTNADRTLVLLDEVDFTAKSLRRTITHEKLVHFLEVLEVP
jgi:hypothetical protein